MFHVFYLLTIPGGLLQGTDYKGAGGGHNRYLSLSVLNGELYCDLQSFPFSGSLGDIISYLLGGETEGSDLRSEGGGSSHLTTDSPQANDLNLIGIKLGGIVVAVCVT